MSRILISAFLLIATAACSPDEQNVVGWIRSAAIPLKTVEAGSGFDDMQPIKGIIGRARLVTLGEATHGTREFFQLKHRMLEFLVREMGFTVFAIEASAPDTVAVNDYVLRGIGDPGRAVDGMIFWTWNTEEVLEMVKWMRAYNEDARNSRKLSFHGFDMQNPGASVDVVERYLRKVDPAAPEAAISPLAPLRRRQSYSSAVDKHAAVLAAIDSLARRLDDHRAAFISKSSLQEWVWARRQIDLMRQGAGLFRERSYPPVLRDQAMAENIRWILGQQPAGTKMLVWAHNRHVSAERHADNPEGQMGTHLRKTFGDQMRIFGFAFDRGELQAVKWRSGVIRHTAPPAAPESFEGPLAAAGIPLFVLDLRHPSGLARTWVASPLKHRSIGAVYSAADDAKFWAVIHPVRSFDAVVFVSRTTAARGRAVSTGKWQPPN